jgi:calcium/calmodulin-dependent protein kinase (CaM kinase) II
MPDPAAELIALNQRLLDAIAAGDWKTYAELCDPSLSAFEPEARGHLVEGMAFHKFYFDLGGASSPHNTAQSSPHVRLMGDVAVVSYVRLNQRVNAQGEPTVAAIEETRVWQRQNGVWRHVHFHRSKP